MHIRHAALASAIVLAVSTAATAQSAAPQAASTPAPQASADLSGTYAGQVLPEGGGDPFEGRIVIVDKGTSIDITLGPRDEPLFPARDVRRNGDELTFEADAPSDTPNHLSFVVTVRDGALTGTMTQERDGQVRKARLELKKQ